MSQPGTEPRLLDSAIRLHPFGEIPVTQFRCEQRTTPRWYPPSLLVAVTVVATLCGCASHEVAHSLSSPAAQSPVLTLAGVDKAISRLREASQDTPPSSLTEEMHRAIASAERFRDALQSYSNYVSKHVTEDKIASLRQLQTALEERQRLQDQVTACDAEVRNSLPRIQDALKNRRAEAPEANDTRQTIEFLATYRRVAATSASVSLLLSKFHQERLENIHPVSTPRLAVLDFLGLRALEHGELGKFRKTYQRAWRGWFDTLVGESAHEQALSLFTFICRASPRYRPHSFRSFADLFDSITEDPPPASVIDRMERTVEELDSIFQAGVRPPNGWKLARSRARAGLLLCRARQKKHHRQSTQIAFEAIQQDPDLAEKSAGYLNELATGLARENVEKGDYTGALDTYREFFKSSNSPAQHAAFDRFREEVWNTAWNHINVHLGRRDYDDVRQALDQLSRIEETAKERARVKETRQHYYDLHTAQLIKQDLRGALELCRQGLKEFPENKALKLRADRAYYSLLVAHVGDVATSHDRFDSRSLRKILGAAVNEMQTEEGVVSCEDLLRQIHESWREVAKTSKSPEVAYQLTIESARLSRADPVRARRTAAKAIWRLFDNAVRAEDWNLVEQCISTHFELCPRAERPRRFKESYAAVVRQLHNGPRTDDAIRHLDLYSRLYPGDGIKLRRDLRSGRSSTSDTENTTGQADRPTLMALTAASATNDVAGPETTGSVHRTRVHAAVGLSFAGLALLAAVVVLSLRRGLLPFGWYAATASTLGTSIGLHLGNGW